MTHYDRAKYDAENPVLTYRAPSPEWRDELRITAASTGQPVSHFVVDVLTKAMLKEKRKRAQRAGARMAEGSHMTYDDMTYEDWLVVADALAKRWDWLDTHRPPYPDDQGFIDKALAIEQVSEKVSEQMRCEMGLI
jgi:plasmid stability protein